MKRLASNYLYIPGEGFLKQHVIEITDTGKLCRIFPLNEEEASVVWLPGVLILMSQTMKGEVIRNAVSTISDNTKRLILDCVPQEYLSETVKNDLYIVRAYPFDFEKFRPCPDTVFRLVD